MKYHCKICNRLSSPIYMYLEVVNRVYATLYCRKHTLEQINESPITAYLTGETVRIVKWKKDHWEDERGEIINAK